MQSAEIGNNQMNIFIGEKIVCVSRWKDGGGRGGDSKWVDHADEKKRKRDNKNAALQ